MELYVILAQRKCDYPGEFGLEDLGSMTEYDHEANDAYLAETLEKARASGEFDRLACITLDVDEEQIRTLLAGQERTERVSLTDVMNPLGLTVLFGQRTGSYPGEYGLEAIASMTDYDVDANPDYLAEQKHEAQASDDFDVIGFVDLEVDEDAVRSILYPEAKSLSAAVLGTVDLG